MNENNMPVILVKDEGYTVDDDTMFMNELNGICKYEFDHITDSDGNECAHIITKGCEVYIVRNESSIPGLDNYTVLNPRYNLEEFIKTIYSYNIQSNDDFVNLDMISNGTHVIRIKRLNMGSSVSDALFRCIEFNVESVIGKENMHMRKTYSSLSFVIQIDGMCVIYGNDIFIQTMYNNITSLENISIDTIDRDFMTTDDALSFLESIDSKSIREISEYEPFFEILGVISNFVDSKIDDICIKNLKEHKNLDDTLKVVLNKKYKGAISVVSYAAADVVTELLNQLSLNKSLWNNVYDVWDIDTEDYDDGDFTVHIIYTRNDSAVIFIAEEEAIDYIQNNSSIKYNGRSSLVYKKSKFVGTAVEDISKAFIKDIENTISKEEDMKKRNVSISTTVDIMGTNKKVADVTQEFYNKMNANKSGNTSASPELYTIMSSPTSTCDILEFPSDDKSYIDMYSYINYVYLVYTDIYSDIDQSLDDITNSIHSKALHSNLKTTCSWCGSGIEVVDGMYKVGFVVTDSFTFVIGTREAIDMKLEYSKGNMVPPDFACSITSRASMFSVIYDAIAKENKYNEIFATNVSAHNIMYMFEYTALKNKIYSLSMLHKAIDQCAVNITRYIMFRGDTRIINIVSSFFSIYISDMNVERWLSDGYIFNYKMYGEGGTHMANLCDTVRAVTSYRDLNQRRQANLKFYNNPKLIAKWNRYKNTVMCITDKYNMYDSEIYNTLMNLLGDHKENVVERSVYFEYITTTGKYDMKVIPYIAICTDDDTNVNIVITNDKLLYNCYELVSNDKPCVTYDETDEFDKNDLTNHIIITSDEGEEKCECYFDPDAESFSEEDDNEYDDPGEGNEEEEEDEEIDEYDNTCNKTVTVKFDFTDKAKHADLVSLRNSIADILYNASRDYVVDNFEIKEETCVIRNNRLEC